MFKKLLATASILAFSASVYANVKSITVIPTQSQVTWKAEKKIMAGHTGTVGIKSSDIKMENGLIAKGSTFVLDMNTIAVTDIPVTKEDNGKLVGHLKSDDFFGVSKNPEAKLAVTSSKSTGPGNLEVTGDLTIKGQTKAITFPVNIKEEKGKTIASGRVVIDRTQFGIKYNSENFVKNLVADRIIKDQFEINFNLTATPATAKK